MINLSISQKEVVAT